MGGRRGAVKYSSLIPQQVSVKLLCFRCHFVKSFNAVFALPTEKDSEKQNSGQFANKEVMCQPKMPP